jgi:4-hydroxybenzoate polyprenyltransferase
MSDVSTMDRPRQRGRPRWLAYLLLGRVSNLPTVWTNCIAGVTLGHAAFGSDLTWLLIALSLMYTAGMFLNDAFDQDFDRRYRPERPIPAGDIKAASVYRAGYGMMAAAILLIGFNTDWAAEPLAWSLLLAALIVYYNYRHKSDPLSPLVMAMCRVMVYFVSASVVGTAIDAQVLIGAATLAAYLVGLTYVAKQENLNDIQNLWPLAFVALPLIHFFRGANLIVTILFVGWSIYALSFLIETPRRIPNAVVSLIAGISLVDAMIVSTVSGQTTLVFYAVGGFLATRLFQKFIPGT